jgi:hypothetical protein
MKGECLLSDHSRRSAGSMNGKAPPAPPEELTTLLGDQECRRLAAGGHVALHLIEGVAELTAKV